MIGAAIAAMLLTSGQVSADPDRLAAMDRRFVCPENLPSPKAKLDALARFDADAAAAIEHMTIDQLGELRMIELRRHRCTETLRNLRQNGVR